MITREEAKAWIDRIADAYLTFRDPLRYGDWSWERAVTYDPWYDNRVPVHELKVIVEALDLPVRRIYSPCNDADEIMFEYKGLRFVDYIRPKRISKKQ